MNSDYNILEDPTYKHYRSLMASYSEEIQTLKSIRDTLSSEMQSNLRFMEGADPPLPDAHLVAYENAAEDAAHILDDEINASKRKLEEVEKDFYEWKMSIESVDSSEEIEQMQEAAKANTRRSKRSRYYPDTGTNYALDA